MSNRYTASGKRISSMTHARRAHTCAICGAVVYGNGGVVSHGRAHVRRGEAVEVVKQYAGIAGTARFFIRPDEVETWDARGYEVVR